MRTSLTIVALFILVVAAALLAPNRASAQSLDPGSLGAEHGTVLYVADAGEDRVVSFREGDSTPEVLVENLGNPSGVAVSGDTLYISDTVEDRVVSAPVSGGDATPITTDVDDPRGLAVSDGMVYIADDGNDRVVAVSVDGDGPTETVATSGLSFPARRGSVRRHAVHRGSWQ